MKSSGFGHSLEFIILLERPPWQGAVPFVMLAILHGGVWLYLWWGMSPLVVGSALSFVVGYFTPDIDIWGLFDPQNA